MELFNISELTSVINDISFLATKNLPNPVEMFEEEDDNFMINDNENSFIIKNESDWDLDRLQAELNEIEEFLSSFNERFGERNGVMLEKAAKVEEMSKQFENDLKSMNDVVEGCTQEIKDLNIFLITSKEELEENKNLEREKQGILNELTEKVETLGETVKKLQQMNI